MTSSRRRLTGRIAVGLPPAEAFGLFTPRGEQEWTDGWQPHFPVPAPDDSEPGTVFETSAHGQHTIWLVASREPGTQLSYAQVIPGYQAGTVTIAISPSDGGSEVEVTYDLTALTPAASQALTEFAGRYPAYLQSWQDVIANCLRNPVRAAG